MDEYGEGDHMKNNAVHEHYKHYTTTMIRRLDGFFGKVDERMNQRIAAWVYGERVLEIGCGFGQLVEYLRKKGFEATGIDQLESWLNEGRVKFPDADLRLAYSEKLDFPDHSIHTVILKDTFHHIYSESDVRNFMIEVRRVCQNRIIIFDPNTTFIVLFSRKLIRHVDPTCSLEQAEDILQQHDFKITHKGYGDVLAFPLSGGFVGTPFVPKLLGPLVLLLDQILEVIIRFLRMDKLFCWRYIIVADKSG